MTQQVRVKELYDDGTALVLCPRQSACSGDCHKCAGCGAVRQTVSVRAVNAIHALPGELVILESDSATVLRYAFVLYILPLALFFLGYGLGWRLWGRGAAAGCVSFAAGVALAAVFDRLVLKKKKTVYTITGYPAV